MIYGAIIGGIVGLIMFIVFAVMKKKGGKVARFSEIVPFVGDIMFLGTQIDNLLKEQGFFPDFYNDETGVYKKGTGVATAAKYIKIAAAEGGVLVEAFVDVYGTESGLNGFIASIPKKTCKKVVEQVIQLIKNS
jgi:hypothetical protein